MVYQNYGPMNGLVSLTNIRNTLADILASSGIRNADRYFAPITPEIELTERNRPRASLIDIQCHICNKTERIPESLMQGREFYRCDRCSSR